MNIDVKNNPAPSGAPVVIEYEESNDYDMLETSEKIAEDAETKRQYLIDCGVRS